MFKLQVKDNPGRSIWLVGEKVTLGSHKDNTLVLDGLGIDEFHAEVFIHPDHLVLKSNPGTCIVNDLPVDAEHRLVANDELRIGKERLTIIDSQQEPELAAGVAAVSLPEGEAADWKLVPEHSRLSEMDFSIHDRAIIGRSKDCELSVPYKLLSREHAELSIVDGQLYLKDLKSANGSFVNGKRIQEARLNNGDKVAFAKLVFTVSGPETTVKKAADKREDEMNRTMIRPAINLNDLLQESKDEAPLSGGSLQLETNEEQEEAAREATSGGGKKTLIGVILALVVLGGVAWYLKLI